MLMRKLTWDMLTLVHVLLENETKGQRIFLSRKSWSAAEACSSGYVFSPGRQCFWSATRSSIELTGRGIPWKSEPLVAIRPYFLNRPT